MTACWDADRLLSVVVIAGVQGRRALARRRCAKLLRRSCRLCCRIATSTHNSLRSTVTVSSPSGSPRYYDTVTSLSQYCSCLFFTLYHSVTLYVICDTEALTGRLLLGLKTCHVTAVYIQLAVLVAVRRVANLSWRCLQRSKSICPILKFSSSSWLMRYLLLDTNTAHLHTLIAVNLA